MDMVSLRKWLNFPRLCVWVTCWHRPKSNSSNFGAIFAKRSKPVWSISSSLSLRSVPNIGGAIARTA